MKAIRSATIGMLTACLLTATGCAANPGRGATPSPDGDNVRAYAESPAPGGNYRQTVADRLERLAESIPQVEKARCVVFGRTAIVGIDVPEGLDRSRVDVIKFSVAEALRHDPEGVSALVTADLDLSRQIADLRDKIQAGRPVAGFAEELADLIGRIVPQMPRDIRQPATSGRTPGNDLAGQPQR